MTSPGDVTAWMRGKGIGAPATAAWPWPPGTITLLSSLIPARFDLEPGVLALRLLYLAQSAHAAAALDISSINMISL
jgi:hypothetical protein